MSDDNYMSAPNAKSVGAFIEALGIFAKHYDGGMDKSFFMGAEHDELFIYDSDTISEESEDGQRLNALGFHYNGEGWSFFT
jgi:hypothetical protein